MPLLDLSSLVIPDIPKGDYSSYKYYIIGEEPCINWTMDEFIYLPQSKKYTGLVADLRILTCETDVLKLYYDTYDNDKGKMTVIPQHDANDYGEPIFTRNTKDELKSWECPENFFYSYNQAQAMLDYIKKKCGTIIGFDRQGFTLINPVGKFNNIEKDLKYFRSENDGKH